MIPASPTDVPGRKRALRAAMRAQLATLSPGQRDLGSRSIRSRLEASREWHSPGVVLGFVALPSEPDLAESLSRARPGRDIALPRWNPGLGEYEAALRLPGALLVPGPFGVPEPGPEAPSVDWERLDLVLVPGLAFDRRGRRLGRGRGFFDRLLARARNARRLGVAFDLQVVADVPTEPRDINVHALVTPGSWLPAFTAGQD